MTSFYLSLRDWDYDTKIAHRIFDGKVLQNPRPEHSVDATVLSR